ncbi:MAG: carbamoyl phosphate synthase large subunit, partial [Succinivibrio sp.]
MRSTGETMGTAMTFPEAYAKSQLAAKSPIQRKGTILLSIKQSDQDRLPVLGKKLAEAGFVLEATKGSCKVLTDAGLECTRVNKVYEGRPNLLDYIKSGRYSWIINTTEGRQSVEDSRSLRRACLRYGITYTTTLNAALASIEAVGADEYATVNSLQELHQQVQDKYSK